MKRIILTTLILNIFFLGNIYAQEISDTAIENPKIMAKGAFMGDSVVLRWAPNNPEGWIIGMNKGFTVERLELNDKHEPVSEWTTLTTKPLLPYSIEKWKSIFAEDSSDVYAMMAAESLYGKYGGKGQEIKPKSVGEIILEAQDFEERFTICLIAADLSPLGAQGMGWRYCDHTAEKGKTYLYNVYCNPYDTTGVRLEHKTIEINTNEVYNPLPIITKYEEKEKQVDLLLDREYHTKRFTAYYFEKSTDGGKTFQRMTNVPYFNPLVEDKNIGNLENIVFTDTLSGNYIPAWYRVIGITPFGTLSTPSEMIKAMGRDRTPPPPPDSIKAVMLKNGTMEIEWKYTNPVADDLNGFILGKSDKPYKNFKLMFEDPLPANARKYIDTVPGTLAPNYYTILTIDTAGNASMARAVLGNYIDTIPPAAPVNVTGKIDTNGIVTLKWSLGPEIDLLGYHVYFNNQKNHFWSNISHNVVQDTTFIDSITLKSLTEKIYYRITALDYNYNVSEFSAVLELQKPDFVPPASPILSKYVSTENSVKLTYYKSHSKDIAFYKLLRKTLNNNWDTIQTYTPLEIPDTLIDTNLKPHTTYTYALVALDDADNISPIAYKLKVKTRKIVPKGEITSFTVNKIDNQVQIKWDYTGNPDDRILIYRKTIGEKLKLLKNVKAGKGVYIDKHPKLNTNYKYFLGAETARGTQLDYTEEMKIDFE